MKQLKWKIYQIKYQNNIFNIYSFSKFGAFLKVQKIYNNF